MLAVRFAALKNARFVMLFIISMGLPRPIRFGTTVKVVKFMFAGLMIRKCSMEEFGVVMVFEDAPTVPDATRERIASSPPRGSAEALTRIVPLLSIAFIWPVETGWMYLTKPDEVS